MYLFIHLSVCACLSVYIMDLHEIRSLYFGYWINWTFRAPDASYGNLIKIYVWLSVNFVNQLKFYVKL